MVWTASQAAHRAQEGRGGSRRPGAVPAGGQGRGSGQAGEPLKSGLARPGRWKPDGGWGSRLGLHSSLRPAGPCPDLREWTWGLGLPGPVPSPHLGSTGLGMRQAHGSREVAVCGLGAPPQPMLASGLGSGTLLEGVGGPAAATWGKGAGTLVTLRKLRQSIEVDMQHEGDEPRRWWMMQGQV